MSLLNKNNFGYPFMKFRWNFNIFRFSPLAFRWRLASPKQLWTTGAFHGSCNSCAPSARHLATNISESWKGRDLMNRPFGPPISVANRKGNPPISGKSVNYYFIWPDGVLVKSFKWFLDLLGSGGLEHVDFDFKSSLVFSYTFPQVR